MWSDPAPGDLDEWIARIADPGYWRELAPGLTVEGPPAAPLVDADEAMRAALWNWMRVDGYYQHPPVVPAALIASMAGAVRALTAEGLPATFAFAYDEPWHLGAWFRPWLEIVLGADFRQLPYFWAWNVDGSSDEGWTPHRDDASFATLTDSGMPKKVTVWVPLTEATPMRSCIYVLPALYDDAYRARDAKLENPRLEDIRALPAAPGAFLCWNSAVLHWGSRRSDKAEGERISLSIEYQRADAPPYARPLLDPLAPPPLRARLGLIGMQLRQYENLSGYSDAWIAVGRELERRLLSAA